MKNPYKVGDIVYVNCFGGERRRSFHSLGKPARVAKVRGDMCLLEHLKSNRPVFDNHYKWWYFEDLHKTRREAIVFMMNQQFGELYWAFYSNNSKNLLPLSKYHSYDLRKRIRILKYLFEEHKDLLSPKIPVHTIELKVSAKKFFGEDRLFKSWYKDGVRHRKDGDAIQKDWPITRRQIYALNEESGRYICGLKIPKKCKLFDKLLTDY